MPRRRFDVEAAQAATEAAHAATEAAHAAAGSPRPADPLRSPDPDSAADFVADEWTAFFEAAGAGGRIVRLWRRVPVPGGMAWLGNLSADALGDPLTWIRDSYGGGSYVVTMDRAPGVPSNFVRRSLSLVIDGPPRVLPPDPSAPGNGHDGAGALGERIDALGSRIEALSATPQTEVMRLLIELVKAERSHPTPIPPAPDLSPLVAALTQGIQLGQLVRSGAAAVDPVPTAADRLLDIVEDLAPAFGGPVAAALGKTVASRLAPAAPIPTGPPLLNPLLTGEPTGAPPDPAFNPAALPAPGPPAPPPSPAAVFDGPAASPAAVDPGEPLIDPDGGEQS